ncbi:hypothetical protein MCOR03_001344 [Pyricularia oryzae]|uniref:Uncharacterized protein n=1 Tax=Pyricularia grisea TaxID=148305 RepID=A0ABQ8NRF7_PYRGI|nr:hypothetical protein MCOR33_003282 [Pyricularia grisea]KAI6400754.1 hypothetical protein MCOR23_004661 [Pyricularia oryzae]KAI6526846.1 hypothetical protein MCOR10_004310 [Pyricularia oryzae]KAI6533437.1 hypothetical protein MCOR05_006726 [Pyricularia oryzae]KAI6566706.1 hypothetical protein MCOR03_001344 [Pyricularia oryzae]
MFSRPRRLSPEQQNLQKYGQLTVFDAFNSPVLALTKEKPPKQDKINIDSRGKSTVAASPPIFWFEYDASDYIQTAEHALSDQGKTGYIKATYMPAPYPQCPLVSEADVVRATALWILHPIILTLQEMFEDVRCSSEDTRPGLRCDTLITIDNKAVFVFEYKTRGYLVGKQYLNGRLDLPTARDSRSLLEFERSYRAKVSSEIEDLTLEGELAKPGYWVPSRLGHNAACITKQAQAYSRGYGTRYVACFDWDNLFLWHFAGNTWGPGSKEFGKRTFKSETWAWGTLITDRACFRKVLLGFILQAHYDRNRRDRQTMGPAPWDQTEKDKRIEANSLAHQSNRRDAPSAAAGSATQRVPRDQQPQTPQRPRPPPSASSYAPSELQGSSRNRPSRPSDPRPPSSSGHVSAQRLSSDQRQSPDHRYAAGQRYPSDQRPPPNHGYSDQPGRGSQRLLTASDPRRGSSRDPSPSSSSSHARRDSSSHHRSADYPVYDRPHSRSRYPVDDPGYDYRPQQAAPYPPDDYGVPRYSDMPAPPSTSRSRQGPPSATSPQPKRSLQERQHGSSPYGPPPSSAGQGYPSGIADLLADSAEVVKEARQVPMKGVSQVLVVREDSLEKDAGRSSTNKRSRGFLGVW